MCDSCLAEKKKEKKYLSFHKSASSVFPRAQITYKNKEREENNGAAERQQPLPQRRQFSNAATGRFSVQEEERDDREECHE